MTEETRRSWRDRLRRERRHEPLPDWELDRAADVIAQSRAAGSIMTTPGPLQGSAPGAISDHPEDYLNDHRHRVDHSLVERPDQMNPDWWKAARVADVCTCTAYQLVNPGGARSPWILGHIPSSFVYPRPDILDAEIVEPDYRGLAERLGQWATGTKSSNLAVLLTEAAEALHIAADRFGS